MLRVLASTSSDAVHCVAKWPSMSSVLYLFWFTKICTIVADFGLEATAQQARSKIKQQQQLVIEV
jgi:hypothetical protein